MSQGDLIQVVNSLCVYILEFAHLYACILSSITQSHSMLLLKLDTLLASNINHATPVRASLP